MTTTAHHNNCEHQLAHNSSIAQLTLHGSVAGAVHEAATNVVLHAVAMQGAIVGVIHKVLVSMTTSNVKSKQGKTKASAKGSNFHFNPMGSIGGVIQTSMNELIQNMLVLQGDLLTAIGKILVSMTDALNDINTQANNTEQALVDKIQHNSKTDGSVGTDTTKLEQWKAIYNTPQQEVTSVKDQLTEGFQEIQQQAGNLEQNAAYLSNVFGGVR